MSSTLTLGVGGRSGSSCHVFLGSGVWSSCQVDFYLRNCFRQLSGHVYIMPSPWQFATYEGDEAHEISTQSEKNFEHLPPLVWFPLCPCAPLLFSLPLCDCGVACLAANILIAFLWPYGVAVSAAMRGTRQFCCLAAQTHSGSAPQTLNRSFLPLLLALSPPCRRPIRKSRRHS